MSLVCAASCGGQEQSSSASALIDGTLTPLPVCSWPAEFDAHATDGACRAARLFLDCHLSNGISELCLSNDPMACPDSGTSSAMDCEDRCHADEYPLGCGGIGDSGPPPPDGCRSLAPDPGGASTYCCPCG